MADSLFDKRYRYDYIYPRGRSGETLRAIDIESNERAVVIKRPAPNDAPPIRAGQEVSINNERRALQRLSGHPVLTALLNEGQFFVGGMPHQYIVMERAEGIIVGDEVLARNANGERLPELETLVMVDHLLDLLYAAHAKDIVYNDVDAKHLFWNRDTYSLKVVDWGNAVFLEGDEVTQQGISRQTDVYQVGELLYFIFTGGRRAEVPRDAGADFAVDFGDDQRRVHSRLQEIISKALHPNLRYRYSNIMALRADLSNYRAPIERERNLAVAGIRDQLQRNDLSMSELRSLSTRIEPLYKQDEGYPPAREAYHSILDRLRDLSVEADLDAVRIYMLNGNWARSADLIRELRENAGTKTGGLSDLLLDFCVILTDNDIDPAPQPVLTAIEQTFNNQPAAAALTLLEDVKDKDQRSLQWQLAERISSHMQEVLLLRPNLYRIQNALRQMTEDGYEVDEPKQLIGAVNTALDQIEGGELNLAFLRDSYRSVVDTLTTLNPILQTFAAQHQLSTRQVPLNALERALSAAMALADSMHIIGKQATSTREALNALENSRAIDPTNPIWDDLEDLLERLYERLQSSQTYVPAADGSDLAEWLQTSREKLRPFQERLFDDMLRNMIQGLGQATEAWQTYQRVVLEGNRDRAISSLEQAGRAVRTISPALSQWFRQLKTVVEGANYIERHALPGGVGRALADGWAAYDRGRLSDAERLGQQANEIARSEDARGSAQRLQDISRLTREWVERNGVASESRSKVALDAVEKLFTDEENRIRQDFESQMPSIETYLKAMSKGLVTTFSNTSTAGLRILYFYYLLQGTLDVHENLLEDGEFWRDAAIKCLEQTGPRHIATRTLDEYIIRRRDLIEAQRLLSQMNGKQIISEIVTIRRALENNAQARLLSSGIQSLRDFETALRHWSDGEFRSAGMKLEEAVQGVTEVETAANLDLSGYRAWLIDLMEHAATLAVRARELRAIIEQRPDAPEDKIRDTLDNQVYTTQKLLGNEHDATLRQWRDTYVQFISVYEADERRSKRLEQLDEFFRALFIDQHPLYPLYRHWYGILEAQSEFPAPPTTDPTPREESADRVNESAFRNDTMRPVADVSPPRRSGNMRRMMLYGGVAIVAIVAVIFTATRLFDTGDSPEVAVTISATPNEATQEAITNATETRLAIIGASQSEEDTPTAVTTAPTRTIAPSPVASATAVAVAASDTATSVPTETPTIPTNTPTASSTPTLTPTTPAPTLTPLPPGGVRGRQDLIALFNRTPNLPFNQATFFGVAGGYQLETNASSTGEIVRIIPPEELLEDSYGNSAIARITSIEAELSLLTFNPSLLNDEEKGVYFGISMESAADGNNIGIQIDALDNNTITVSELRNGTLSQLRTRSVGTIVVRLRIDRNIETGSVLLFLNDEQLTPADEFLEPDAEVLPVLFVRDGGVIVRVNDWRIGLR